MEHFKAYKDICVGRLLTLLAQEYGEREALVYPNCQVRYNFTELEAVANNIAKGLLALGIEKGERVALWASNLPEWVILQFALAKIGAILITVNTGLRTREIAYLLEQSEACAIILMPGFKGIDYIATLQEIVPELAATKELASITTTQLPHLRHAILLDENPPPGFLSYSTLTKLGATISEQTLAEHQATLDVDDVINMQYTSGTTGFPKGVMLSHRNILNNGYWLGQAMAYTPADRLCLPVPLFHCFGCVIGVMGIYTHGGCLILLEYFDAVKVLTYVEQERCTALYGVPTMFIAVLEEPDFARFNLTTLRTGTMAGALCPEALMRRVIKHMHLRDMIIAYGLTEASPGITHTLRDDTIEHRTQTVGKVMPEQQVVIIDPVTQEILPIDMPGELCVRGYNVMKGYYNNEAATEAALIRLMDQPNWLRTGDQATIDAQGYVRITGRIKEIIIRGGENIAPKEIEDLLRQHPKISDVCVYGVADEKYGETIAAAIRLQNSQEASVTEILEFCAGRIAKFKIPQYIKFVREFPVTASGKIQRFRLREMHLLEEKFSE